MVNALTHSRPPSYKSHISDHPIIESGGNNAEVVSNVTNAISGGTGNNSVRSGGGSRMGSSSVSGHHHHQSQVQVAQVQVHPRTSPDHHSVVHSVVGSNQRLTADPTSGQDISIVPVSSAAPHKSVEFNSKSDLKNDPDFHHHYHIKIGENGQDLCDVDTASDYELFDNNGKKAEEAEKRSVVTIVQTSTTNSSPVIVTVSGSAIGESEGSGSEFSDIRASPAEVEILATL